MRRPIGLVVCISVMSFNMMNRVPIVAQETDLAQITIERLNDRLQVWVNSGDERVLFTEYRHTGFAKPILYPVLATGNVAVTRHFPIKKGQFGESTDHPHHKSIWFAHGDVNGLDYWSEKSTIRHRKVEEIDGNRFVVTNDWMDGETKVCEDRTSVNFLAGDRWRMIDYCVTISATEGKLVFGDTKEGTFAIRTHPALRLKSEERNPAGTAFNSEGVKDAAIWGKNARWVHYQGIIGSEVYGITVMDYPGNLRHPTTWHAREYGLIAANPFGLSYFRNEKRGSGNYTLEKDATLAFRYGVLISQREMTAHQIEKRFEEFAGRN